MTVSDLFLPRRAKAWPLVADQLGEIWWTGGHCGQGMGLWDSQTCLQISPAVSSSILPESWYLIIPYRVTGFTVFFPSQQSGFSMPLMVGYVMNKSTNPHAGIKGSVKDCGCTHMNTLMAGWWSLVEGWWGTNISHVFIFPLHHTTCITIFLHSYS